MTKHERIPALKSSTDLPRTEHAKWVELFFNTMVTLNFLQQCDAAPMANAD